MSEFRFSIGITAVPERVDMLQAAVARLREVAPGIKIDAYMDHGRVGVLRNTLRAFRDTYGLPYRMVIQEDVAVCLDFGAAVERMIDSLRTRHDTFIVGLYSNSSDIARKGQVAPLVYTWDMWGVCNLYASAVLPHLEAFAMQYERMGSTPLIPDRDYAKRPDGTRGLTLDSWPPVYCKMVGVPMFATFPSLVQHIGGLRSALGHKFDPAKGKNISHYYIGTNTSALTVDWSVLPPACAIKAQLGAV